MIKVRDMQEIGAADIAEGQRWLECVTQACDRRIWTVAERRHDDAVLTDGDTDRAVSFGSLLSGWVLLDDAEPNTPGRWREAD